jgi:xylosylprotein 4-beta-galactosyltransferase
MAKCFNQRQVTRKRDRQTGLNNVSYKIENAINATIINTPMTILNISLMCDESITPWCLCDTVNVNKDKKTKDKKKNS